MVQSYKIEEWIEKYKDRRFRDHIGRSSNVLVSPVDDSEDEYVFSFSSRSEDSSVIRKMESDINPEIRTNQKQLGDGILIEEILLENVYFNSSQYTNEQKTDHHVELVKKIQEKRPHIRMRFSHCYFENWFVPSDLGHDMYFDGCIFNTPVKFTGRLTSDVTFLNCIFFKEASIHSCQGLGTFIIEGSYVYRVNVMDSVIAALIFRDSVASGVLEFRSSKFRRTLGFDSFCHRPIPSCDPHGISNHIIISNCVIGGSLNLVKSDFGIFDCRNNTLESLLLNAVSSKGEMSFDKSQVRADFIIREADLHGLSLHLMYVYNNMFLSTDDERLLIRGTFDCSNLTVKGDAKILCAESNNLLMGEARFNDLYLCGTKVRGNLEMTEVEVDGKCWLTSVFVQDKLDMKKAVFLKDLVLSMPDKEASTFHEVVLDGAFITESVKIISPVNLDSIALSGISAENLQMTNIRCNSIIDFTDADIRSNVSISLVSIEGDLKMNGSDIGSLTIDELNVDDLQMEHMSVGDVLLSRVSVESIYMDDLKAEGVEIKLDTHCRVEFASFTNMNIDGPMKVVDAKFDCHSDFSGSTFSDEVRFEHIVLSKGITFESSVFKGNCLFNFKVSEDKNVIDLSKVSFVRQKGNVNINVINASDDTKINLCGMSTNSNIYFDGLVFDRYENQIMMKSLYRIFGENVDVFSNLWSSSNPWGSLEDEWSVLEQIYRIRGQHQRVKDAYVWRRFCERKHLKNPSALKEDKS